ncbi:MAG: class I SAM-dependent methyltransferase [Actinomycetota bacterium]
MTKGNPIFARFYATTERLCGDVQEKDRRRLLEGAHGRIVEIGAGSGANFKFYPSEVTEVIAIEPEPYLRSKAVEAARSAAVDVKVFDASADSIPLEDDSCDGAVFSLVLCSVPSQSKALSEAFRVLKSSGELRFYEHVRGHGVVGAMQKISDATLWPMMCGGCHTNRDTVSSIKRAGFRIERLKELSFKPMGMPLPVTPHVIGLAIKP